MDLILGPWHSFVDLIEWCLVWLADFTGNGGLAIILFTLAVKTLLLPDDASERKGVRRGSPSRASPQCD